MSKANDRANVSATKRVAVWFKLYINDIKIKGSRVTLDNGGVKVHLNLNNLDQPSRASAIEGRGYVKLNTFYAMSLFGMNETKPKHVVKDYRVSDTVTTVPLIATLEGPCSLMVDKAGILAFNKAWNDTYNKMVGYDPIAHLRNIGVRGLAA